MNVKMLKAKVFKILVISDQPVWLRVIIIIIIIINVNVYCAVLMTMVTARVHPVHLMNTD